MAPCAWHEFPRGGNWGGLRPRGKLNKGLLGCHGWNVPPGGTTTPTTTQQPLPALGLIPEVRARRLRTLHQYPEHPSLSDCALRPDPWPAERGLLRSPVDVFCLRRAGAGHLVHRFA